MSQVQAIDVELVGGSQDGTPMEVPLGVQEWWINPIGDQVEVYRWANRSGKDGIWLMEFMEWRTVDLEGGE